MTSMQSPASDGGPPPTWSLDGVREGAVVMIPALPGIAVFGAAFGALAAERGLTTFEAVLMSGVVFAGVAQIASMELWSPRITPALVLTIAFTSLVINLRMLLMSASLRPWLAGAPPLQVVPGLYILTDTNWVAALRYRREGGADVGYLLGGGLIIWLVFVPATALGRIFGSLLADPRPYAVDMILRSILSRCWRRCSKARAGLCPGRLRAWSPSRSSICFRDSGTSSPVRSQAPSPEDCWAMNEVLPHGVLFVIATMTAASVFTRLAGFWMMGHVTLTPRIRRMLEALPGSVVAALILPVVLKEGLPAGIAMAAVALMMIWRRNEFLALACGIAIIAGIRATGW